MSRKRPTTLEPIAPSMVVVVFAHLALGFGVWWWWQEWGRQPASSRMATLTWMNPADFTSNAPKSVAVDPPKAAAATPSQSPPPASARTPTPPKPEAAPPVPKATLVAAPPEQHRMEPVPNDVSAPLFAQANPQPKPSANRSITLRRTPDRDARPTAPPAFGSPAPPMTSPTLLDIARLNRLRPMPPPTPGAVPEAPDDAGLDVVDEAVNSAFLAAWTAPPIDAVPPAQREARLNVSLGKDGTILKAQMSKFSGSHVLDQSILEASAHVKKISVTLPATFAKESYDLELNFLLLP
ncbi:MAG: hypothetical protein U1F71_21455 [Verrucomicrobiaceae bacterium]